MMLQDNRFLKLFLNVLPNHIIFGGLPKKNQALSVKAWFTLYKYNTKEEDTELKKLFLLNKPFFFGPIF